MEAETKALLGPLACRASNSEGEWEFTAPGNVQVVRSATPLTIICQTTSNALVEPSQTSSIHDSPSQRGREGATTGAEVGFGAGVAIGVAAAPVMGGAFGLVLAAGAALKGAEIGGLVGTLQGGDGVRYPSPVVLHISTKLLGSGGESSP